MKFEPKYYKTHPCSKLLLVESVYGVDGTLSYCVSYGDGVDLNRHVFFKKMSSVLDFLQSNFRNI